MAVPGRPKSATRRKSGGSFLLGMFVGLIMGLSIALGVAFYLNRTPIPLASKGKPSGTEAGGDTTKMANVAGLPQTGAATEKPKFDFYRILPGGEEPVSEKELKERLRAPAAPDKAPRSAPKESSREIYFVQAGSFQNPVDADNQKARLAMLGFESIVEPANLPDKGTWYRVRLGPYAKLEEIAKVRQSLSQNGINASLIKLNKDAATPKGR